MTVTLYDVLARALRVLHEGTPAAHVEQALALPVRGLSGGVYVVARPGRACR